MWYIFMNTRVAIKPGDVSIYFHVDTNVDLETNASALTSLFAELSRCALLVRLALRAHFHSAALATRHISEAHFGGVDTGLAG